MELIKIIAWVLMAVSISGNYFNIKKLRVCFIIWTLCNIGWIIIDFYNGYYSRVILDTAQAIFCLYGFFKWRTESNGETKD